MSEQVREVVEAVYRTESRRVFATLVRLLGDFELAEEALHEAFASAVVQWPRDGVPANPRAWLVSAGRFKAVDAIRRRARFDASLAELAEREPRGYRTESPSDEDVEDDRLRLIFTCCHPALSAEARVALTLREVCGLTTEEIARAFLTSPATLAQRIVRAKAKIKGAKIPYEVPSRAELPERLDAVLQVVYLVFNEGYSASAGESLTRSDLSDEAIRLGRLLVELLPDSETHGLLGLMLLHESRRAARCSPSGEVILLEDQDRSRWNRELIAEGLTHTARAFSFDAISSYAIQAAIAAVHAEARAAADTDWRQIALLYGELLALEPSPVVALNRAVAVAMADGPDAGLAELRPIERAGELAAYPYLQAVKADLLRRAGRAREAALAYERAIGLTRNETERAYLRRRLAEC